MKPSNKKPNAEEVNNEAREQKDIEEHLVYPPSEDIYNRAVEVDRIDVDDLSKRKAPNILPDAMNEKDFADDLSGKDLDVPGGADDERPINGKEDEENDFYSTAQ